METSGSERLDLAEKLYFRTRGMIWTLLHGSVMLQNAVAEGLMIVISAVD